MSTESPINSGNSKKEPSEQRTHVTVEFARQSFDHAIEHAQNGIYTVAENCAVGFVDAYKQCYSTDETHSIFTVCGSGLNGLVGLYTARNLKAEGYDVAIHAAGSSRYVDVTSFCKDHDLTLFDFVPSTVEFYYQAVIDALLGVGFDGGDVRETYWQVQEMLVTTNLPIASIDAPTGWDLTTGPRPIDVAADTFVKPDLLVSLGAPLACAKAFAGEYHFIAGRHLPAEYYSERGITVPVYPQSAHSVLFRSILQPYVGNGAVYGRPGQFNATLFNKKPRRRWVDVEEEMDLWDELE